MLAALPTPVFAEACAKLRPGWDGTEMSALDEAIHVFSTVPALFLIVATAVAIRFRSQWGGLVLVVLWTLLASVHSVADPTGLRAAGLVEGCVGPSILFISAVTAICVAMILYTAPLGSRSN